MVGPAFSNSLLSPPFWPPSGEIVKEYAVLMANLIVNRKLFFNAAKILDPNLFEQVALDDDHIQNISTLYVGLDLNLSNDELNHLMQNGEEEDSTHLPQLLTSNDPNLANHAGDLTDLIDISHVKRSKFDRSLNEERIVEILFNEY